MKKSGQVPMKESLAISEGIDTCRDFFMIFSVFLVGIPLMTQGFLQDFLPKLLQAFYQVFLPRFILAFLWVSPVFKGFLRRSLMECRKIRMKKSREQLLEESQDQTKETFWKKSQKESREQSMMKFREDSLI